MSKAGKQLVKDIRTNPKDWRPIGTSIYSGISKDNIRITSMGNTRMLSVIHVCINDVWLADLSYFDNWSLEVAVMWWYKQADLSEFTKEQANDINH